MCIRKSETVFVWVTIWEFKTTTYRRIPFREGFFFTGNGFVCRVRPLAFLSAVLMRMQMQTSKYTQNALVKPIERETGFERLTFVLQTAYVGLTNYKTHYIRSAVGNRLVRA